MQVCYICLYAVRVGCMSAHELLHVFQLSFTAKFNVGMHFLPCVSAKTWLKIIQYCNLCLFTLDFQRPLPGYPGY